MIKIENVEVRGWEAAIRGMRNPMNSHDKSDSVKCLDADFPNCIGCYYRSHSQPLCTAKEAGPLILGKNDLKLMRNLAKAGNDHAKFARWIDVTLDVTAPLYWWKEFETYRAGVKQGDGNDNLMDVEMNSCSTMHKIHEKEFTLDDFSCEHVENFPGFKSHETYGYECALFKNILTQTIDALNWARKLYLQTKDKRYWWQMIQLLPTSYNQKRTLKLNYQVLWSMYKARKDHKLDEWREFCEWCESLPYFKEIYLEG